MIESKGDVIEVGGRHPDSIIIAPWLLKIGVMVRRLTCLIRRSPVAVLIYLLV